MVNDQLTWDFAFDVGPEYLEKNGIVPKQNHELKQVAKFYSSKFNF